MKDCWDDCCPYCGEHIHSTQSICSRCSDVYKEGDVREKSEVSEREKSDVREKEKEEKQQLLRLLNVGCYSHDGTLWRACRATYIVQWESLDHMDKKRKRTTTLPPLSQVLSVSTLSFHHR